MPDWKELSNRIIEDISSGEYAAMHTGFQVEYANQTLYIARVTITSPREIFYDHTLYGVYSLHDEPNTTLLLGLIDGKIAFPPFSDNKSYFADYRLQSLSDVCEKATRLWIYKNDIMGSPYQDERARKEAETIGQLMNLTYEEGLMTYNDIIAQKHPVGRLFFGLSDHFGV